MDNLLSNTPARFHTSLDCLFEDMQQAVREAVLDHKRAGNPIAIWQDGKVVIVPPEEIVVPELGESDAGGETEPR